jgi:hypothetical protein
MLLFLFGSVGSRPSCLFLGAFIILPSCLKDDLESTRHWAFFSRQHPFWVIPQRDFEMETMIGLVLSCWIPGNSDRFAKGLFLFKVFFQKVSSSSFFLRCSQLSHDPFGEPHRLTGDVCTASASQESCAPSEEALKHVQDVFFHRLSALCPRSDL